MTTTTCDRCGAEIREFMWQVMRFPTYSIMKADVNVQGVVTIDLCRKCQDDFTEWLKGKPNDGNNGDTFDEIKSIPVRGMEEEEDDRENHT